MSAILAETEIETVASSSSISPLTPPDALSLTEVGRDLAGGACSVTVLRVLLAARRLPYKLIGPAIVVTRAVADELVRAYFGAVEPHEVRRAVADRGLRPGRPRKRREPVAAVVAPAEEGADADAPEAGDGADQAGSVPQ